MRQFPLIGRDNELQQLRRLMTEAQTGHGSLLLLGGESGAGKTALLEAVTRGAAGQLEAGQPEAGQLEAATHGGADPLVLTGHCPGPDETQMLGPWKEAIAQLARLGHDPSPLPFPLGAQELPAWNPPEVASLLTDWLIGRGRSLMMVLEDIHWADHSSLELLRYITPNLGGTPLLLVASYRTDEVYRLHPLWRLLPELQRTGAGRLLLERLTPESVRELTAHALPALAAPEEAAGHLYRRTGGNALFVRELLAEAARTGQSPERIQGLPETLQQAIDTRLDRLDAQTLALLQMAALIGERFGFGFLVRAAGLPEDDVAVATQEALSLRIIRSEEGDSFAFDHALVREALLYRLIPVQRRRYHRQIADALLAAGSLDAEALAFHLSRARDIRAVSHLTTLGDRALRRGMLLPAQAAYEQALDLLPEGAKGRAELYLKMGQTVRYADRDRANLHWEEAVREAGLTGEQAASVWARTQSLSFPTRHYPPKAEAVVRPLINEAEGLLSDSDYLRLEHDLYGCASGYPRAIAYLAEVRLASGRFAEASAVVDEMQARTLPGSNPYPVIFLKAQLAWVAGEYERRLDLVRRMAAAQYETGYYRNVVEWEAVALGTLLNCRADSPEQVDAQARRVLELQAEARERSGYTINDGYEPIGSYQFLRGDWEGAHRNLLEPLRAGSSVGWFVRSEAAEMLSSLGDPALALETLAPLLPISPEAEPGHTVGYEIGTQLQRAQILLQLGEKARARAWLEAAGRWLAQRPIAPVRPAFHVTWAAYFDATGEPEQAEAAAREGLDWALRLPDLPQQIEARRMLGRLAAQAGRTGEAEAHLTAALDLAERCRFPHEAERTRALLAGLPSAGAGSPGSPAPASLPDGLSPREAEVIRLVARGLTDRQVGAELFISPRTVDGHLRRIFVKVGVASRAALGAYAVRLGLDR